MKMQETKTITKEKETTMKSRIRKAYPNDYDKIDTEAFYDSKITYEENLTLFKEKYPLLKNLKEQKEETEEELLKAKNEELKLMERQIEKANKKTKAIPQSDRIKGIYSLLIRTCKMTAKGYFTACFVKGSTGNGKTFQVRNTLLEIGLKRGEDFDEYGGNITPATLYKLLIENKDKKAIIFNDCGKLFRNTDSVDLLKQATESDYIDEKGRRLIQNHSMAHQLKDVDNSAWIKPTLIFTFNSIDKGMPYEDLKALFNRGKFVELVLSTDDMVDVIRSIAKTKEEKETTEYLIKKYQKYTMSNFNLRLQQRAFAIRKYSEAHELNWKKEIDDEVKREMWNDNQKILYECNGTNWIRRRIFELWLMNEKAWSLSKSKRFVSDMVETEQIHTDGKMKQMQICLLPYEIGKKKMVQMVQNS